jgi:hypothetical protein
MAKKLKSKPIKMYVNSGSDYSIEDGSGKFYTVEEAKAVWESGVVSDVNLAFHNLATKYDFDMDKLKASHKALASKLTHV